MPHLRHVSRNTENFENVIVDICSSLVLIEFFNLEKVFDQSKELSTKLQKTEQKEEKGGGIKI